MKNEDLLLAARDGDEAQVRRLLRIGEVGGIGTIDVNAKDGSSLTSLLLASSAGHRGVVRMLLQHGADIEDVDSDGNSPLLLAAKYGHKEVVRLLLRTGADTGAANNDGDTALMLAAGVGHLQVIQLLLRNGADAGAMNDCGEGAAQIAVSKSHQEVAELLLGWDGSPRALDRKGGLRLQTTHIDLRSRTNKQHPSSDSVSEQTSRSEASGGATPRLFTPVSSTSPSIMEPQRIEPSLKDDGSTQEEEEETGNFTLPPNVSNSNAVCYNIDNQAERDNIPKVWILPVWQGTIPIGNFRMGIKVIGTRGPTLLYCDFLYTTDEKMECLETGFHYAYQKFYDYDKLKAGRPKYCKTKKKFVFEELSSNYNFSFLPLKKEYRVLHRENLCFGKDEIKDVDRHVYVPHNRGTTFCVILCMDFSWRQQNILGTIAFGQ